MCVSTGFTSKWTRSNDSVSVTELVLEFDKSFSVLHTSDIGLFRVIFWEFEMVSGSTRSAVVGELLTGLAVGIASLTLSSEWVDEATHSWAELVGSVSSTNEVRDISVLGEVVGGDISTVAKSVIDVSDFIFWGRFSPAIVIIEAILGIVTAWSTLVQTLT
jgi:hypothetical protein